MTILEGVHPEWIDALREVHGEIRRIENSLQGHEFNPAPENIFKALRNPLSLTSAVIFGQDPYPTPTHAMGLAFSVPVGVKPIPKTLTNIFRELQDDIGCGNPSSGDLTAWADQGVALVNRILTTPQGQSAGHLNLNWQIVTNEIARVLGDREIVAILWGRYAQELSPYFSKTLVISSSHPSPLSAYRGFFGSKPFSRTNQLLASVSRRAIDWSLA
jgi:uracil-DNA glycosylase